MEIWYSKIAIIITITWYIDTASKGVVHHTKIMFY